MQIPLVRMTVKGSFVTTARVHLLLYSLQVMINVFNRNLLMCKLVIYCCVYQLIVKRFPQDYCAVY